MRILTKMLVACSAIALSAPCVAQTQKSGATAAAKVAPPVTPGPEAMKDPIAADPMFWWRLESFRNQPQEPPEAFYWPEAAIGGDAKPFLPLAKAGRTTLSSEALAKAAQWAEANNSSALIIIHKGKVQLERYWNGMSPDKLTNLRAITRSFAPTMLGFAVAEGKVDLDAPIARYLTEWQGKPQGQITVRQVAQNVSGLEHDFPTGTVFGNKQVQLVYAGDVVAAALAMDSVETPGSKFDAADVNMQLISLIIERSMGTPIAELVSERVWKPIGASSAAFQFDRPGGTARTVCCMRATPRDVARLGQLFVQDGRWNGKQVLPAGWVKTMATPSKRNPNFGLGLWLGSPNVAARGLSENKPGDMPQSDPFVQSESFVASDVRMMEGGGYRVLYIVPSKDLVILRLGYSSKTWDHAFLVNTAIRGIRSW